MGRPLRIQYAGAMYHVMGCGQRREAIVRDDDDRVKLAGTLEEACQRFRWEVFAYALMSNHYHLIFRTPHANLSLGMQWLLGTYATRFRVRHRTAGSVFAARYKALLIEEDARRLRTVVEYVHLNAWRAGLAQLESGLEGWPWSSLPLYTRPASRRPRWLMVEEVLGWGQCRDDARGRRHYLDELEARARLGTRRGDEERGEMPSLTLALKRGWYFGSERFREQLQERLKVALRAQKNRGAVDAVVRRDYGEKEARRLLEAACRQWDWKEEQLRRLPKGDRQKTFLAWWLREKSGVSLRWLSENLHTGAIAATCRLAATAGRSRHSTPAAQWLRQLERISI